MAYNRRNKLRRDLRVIDIVNANYVPGIGTYKEIWSKYIYPVYPMSYGSFLKIINTPVAAELREAEQRCEAQDENPNQLKLFKD